MIDWDNYLYEIDLKFDDLDIEVQADWVEFTNTYGPMRDYDDVGEVDHSETGTIREWIYTFDLSEEDYADFLNKKIEDITEEDLENIDEKQFEEFLRDKYFDKAIEDAEENWEADDVSWED
jgi:sulfatase maturation enzyme AslB (radical SAM superfamily)